MCPDPGRTRTGDLVKVVVAVENTTDWSRDRAPRDEIISHSLVAVHTMLAVDDGVVRVVARPARGRPCRGGGVRERRHVPRAHRRWRRRCSRRRSSSTTSRRSLPRARRPLRRDRDRRDPRASCADPDRRREGGGTRHRSSGRRHHRPLRRHAARAVGPAPRRDPHVELPNRRRKRSRRRSRRRSRGGIRASTARSIRGPTACGSRARLVGKGSAVRLRPVPPGRRPRPLPRRSRGDRGRDLPRRRRQRARRGHDRRATRRPRRSSGRGGTSTSIPTRSSRSMRRSTGAEAAS